MKARKLLPVAAVSAALLAGATAPAATAAPSCLRGGASLETADGPVRVVRVEKRATGSQTRRELVLACWAPTGKRFKVAREVDLGLDNVASTTVEIVGERYVGVQAVNTGGVSEYVQARVYDARQGRKLHDSRRCEADDQGDLVGPVEVVFLDSGGMAMACQQLVLYRGRDAKAEVLEPEGTYVRSLAVSRARFGGTTLYWTAGDGDGEARALRL